MRTHGLRSRLARLERADSVRDGGDPMPDLLALARVSSGGGTDEDRARVEATLPAFLELTRAAMARPDRLEEAKRRCVEEQDRQAGTPAPDARGDAN